MKDKLEVGMYVRTKNNPYIPSEIAQMIKMDDKYIYLDIDKDSNVVWEYPEYIEKASHNIIDLIEVGDYVNGLLVTRILEDNETKKKYINLYGSISEWEEEDIKSIVTKEQFESMEYSLGDVKN